GFVYSLDGGAFQASPTFTGVAPGAHNLTAANAADQTCVSAQTPISVNAVPAVPAAPPAAVTTQPTCATPTGTIDISAPLGAEFVYSLDGGAFQATQKFTGVAPGAHNLPRPTPSGQTLVSAQTPISVNSGPAVPAAPTAAVTTQPTCATPTGTIDISAPLGAGFVYSLDGGTFQASPTFTGGAPGAHNLTAANAADQTCVSAQTPISVNAVPAVPAAPTAAVTTQPTCATPTGTIDISAPLGAGFVYSLDGGAFQASPTFTGVAPGAHNLTAANAADQTCVSAQTPISVNAVPAVPAAPTAAVTTQPT